MYASTYYVNDPARTWEGVTGWSHNSVQSRTRNLFSGQGYRLVQGESRVGHLVLRNATDTVVIDTVWV